MEQYEKRVALMMKRLCEAFDSDINLLVAHVMIDGITIGPESGERPLHIGQTYAVAGQQLPNTPQYIGLGHVHAPQQVKTAPVPTYYSGSLLQMDFGEAGQTKGVQIVECHPRQPAQVRAIPLKSIRQLRNIGKAKEGVTLDEIRALADDVGDALLKVFVKVDRPFPGLAEQVRELLPNALDIVVERTTDEQPDAHPRIEGMSPGELFSAYYQRQHESPPAPELTALFNRLLEEATSAAD